MTIIATVIEQPFERGRAWRRTSRVIYKVKGSRGL